MERVMPSRDCGCSRAPGLTSLLATVSMLSLSAGAALAGEDAAKPVPVATQSPDEELSKKLERMEQRVKLLEEQLRQKGAVASAAGSPPPTPAPAPVTKPANGAVKTAAPAAPAAPAASTGSPLLPPLPSTTGSEKPILGVAESPVPGLSIGAYGEVFFGAMQNPAAGGQWQNGSDAPRRFVFLPTYAITDNIIFNAEIEFEHAGSGFDNDDKLHGTAEIEQLWIDFKIIDQFNWRAPGIDLIPIGYINEHHEPTGFYSVKRPELYNGLIPSTWKAPATSIYGRLTDGLYYTLQASSSVEDFGGDFATRTDANTVPPFPAGYAAGINGVNALGFALPVRGDFRQLS